ncbi:MAG: phosphoenolpyruvate synthase, partial [Lachnospiraceae bacterium]|nr:phosphoenolpyruvate synthase [Lachnospiraceae bacterium]
MYEKLNTAKVLPQFTFTVTEWEQHQESIIRKFSELDWSTDVIVRSSSKSEDKQDASMAGKFESIANVNGINSFQNAVDKVICSY